MEPWGTLVIAGAAIAGYGWLKPEPKQEKASVVGEAAYDRLLEDLETENRELLDAVAVFKREQDETVDRLGRRIRELERQMEASLQRPAPAAAAPAVAEGLGAAIGAAAGSAPGAAEERAAARAPAGEAAGASGLTGREAADTALSAAESDTTSPTAAGPQSIRERYAELIGLYERGRSTEQIAKAMNMNKGEVQLILQLAKREGKRHE